MRLAVLCLATSAAAQQPIDVIKDLDDKFNAAYNAQQFATVAGFYNPGADLVPPTGDAFVPGVAAESFFKQAFASGLTNLTLTPLAVHEESSSLWHEIGNATHSLQPGGGFYYVRWIKPLNTWQIAFDCLSIGGAQSNAQSHHANSREHPASREDNVTALLRGLSDGIAARYNAQDFAGVVGAFNPGALYVPPASSTFLDTAGLQAYLASSYMPGASLTLTPLVAKQESPILIHHIGVAITTQAASTSVTNFYIRWIWLPVGGWQIAFQLAIIGD